MCIDEFFVRFSAQRTHQYTQKDAEGAIKLKTFFEKHAPLDSVTAKRYNNGSITPNKFRGDACFEQ